MRYSLIFLVSLVLCGCTTVRNVEDTYALDETSGNGLLVLAVSRRGGGIQGTVHFSSVDDPRAVRTVSLGQGIIPVPTPNHYGHINRSGQIFAIELPEGLYAFNHWSVVSGYTTITPKEVEKIEFKIEKGVATYLGNFEFEVTDKFGANVTGVSVEWRDDYEEDLSVLQARYPNIDIDLVQRGIAPKHVLSGWGMQGNIETTIPPYTAK